MPEVSYAQPVLSEEPQQLPPPPPQPNPVASIEVKTKFPVARIKRIMQADEDVGKVAQVTPIAVCTCIPLHFVPASLESVLTAIVI
jgi:uncharacterized protein (DUF1499 family)